MLLALCVSDDSVQSYTVRGSVCMMSMNRSDRAKALSFCAEHLEGNHMP